MKRLAAFLRGAAEFRSAVTPHYDDQGLVYAYDVGRDLAHRCTLRRYED